MADRPNILLITTDQQRFDTIGACGSKHARTPNLDRLTDSSVLFDRAYVQNTVCIPSRACIQTGRYTHQHGVRYMESMIDSTPGLPAWETTFMEHLQGAGYQTGATGKIHMMPERGFDYQEIVGGKGARWTQSSGQEIGPAPLGKQYAAWLEARHPGGYELIYEQRRQPEYQQSKNSIVNCLPLEEYVETYILEKSIEFIQQQRSQPFFLWCGFCGPHGPHDPPASHAGLYPFDEIPLPDTWEIDLSDRPPHLRGQSPRKPMTAAEEQVMRRYRALYFSLVALIDEYVGRLVETLSDSGLLDDTLILYTSDHGEMLGDFAKFGKGNFYEPVVHVPLIARPPGGCSPRRCTELVEVMDIAPTILDYAGQPHPPQMPAQSFRTILTGGSGSREGVLSEYTPNDPLISGKCLITERYKYILWDTEQGGEFYDLREDPGELRNLYCDPAYRTERDRHAELLLAHLMHSEIGYCDGRTEPY